MFIPRQRARTILPVVVEKKKPADKTTSATIPNRKSVTNAASKPTKTTTDTAMNNSIDPQFNSFTVNGVTYKKIKKLVKILKVQKVKQMVKVLVKKLIYVDEELPPQSLSLRNHQLANYTPLKLLLMASITWWRLNKRFVPVRLNMRECMKIHEGSTGVVSGASAAASAGVVSTASANQSLGTTRKLPYTPTLITG